MADVQISDLTACTSPSDSDLLLMRHGTTDSKITYSNLKSAIRNNTLYVSDTGVVTEESNSYYNKSQVDALVQAVQDDVDTINTHFFKTLDNNTDLDGALEDGAYVVYTGTGTPLTDKARVYGLMVFSNAKHTIVTQILFNMATQNGMFYVRNLGSGTWTSWYSYKDFNDKISELEKKWAGNYITTESLNDIRVPGNYVHLGDSGNVSNSPNNYQGAFTLTVFYKDSYRNQMVITNGSKIYFRVEFSSGWQPWCEVQRTILDS